MEGYRVGGFDDPAFLNRFCHLTLSGGDTTLEEWVGYMANVHGANATDVIEFASHNVKHLDGDVAGELGFSIQPSRRSWEMVVRVQQVCREGNYNESAKIEVLSGLVGRDLAQAFSRYSCPVKPRELMQNGVKAMAGQLKGLTRNQTTGLMWGIVSIAKTKIDEDKIGDTCLDFAEWMLKHSSDKDLVVAFCRALVSSGTADSQEKARAAVISNPRLAQMMAKFVKDKDGKKSFVTRLTERPELQKVLSKTAWGSTGETADD
jgi:hypothetical protein